MTRKNESDFACQAPAGTPLPQSEASPSSEPKAPMVITDDNLDIQAYQHLLECSHTAIVFLIGQKPIHCNSVALELFAMTREEMLASSVEESSPAFQPNGQPSKELAAHLFEHAMAGRPQMFEWRYRRKDGSEFDAEVTLTRISLGGTSCAAGVVRDITERKASERALRESEARFRYLADKLPIQIQLVDLGGRYIYNNHAIRDFFGLGPNEVLADWKQWVHPDDLPSVLKGTEHPPGQPPPEGFEFRIRNVQGEYRWLWALAVPRKTEDGQILGHIVTAIDITERKAAEQALRQSAEALQQSESTLRSLFQTVPVGLVLMKNRVAYSVNERLCDIAGRSAAEMIGKGTRFLYESEAEYERVGKGLYETLWDKGSCYVETCLKRPDGTFRDVSMFCAPVDLANREAGVAIAVQDITEKRKADEALRESEARFRYLADKLPFHIQLINVEGRAIYVNQSIRDFFGLGPGELLGPWKHLVHPEDMEAVRKGTEHPLGQPLPQGFEFRIRNIQGEYRWLWALRVPRRTSDGQLLGYITSAVDITDRKQAEQAVRSREGMLRSLFQAVPVGLVLMHHRILDTVNDRMCEITGYTAEQMMGQKSRMLFESDEEYLRVGRGLYDHLWERGSSYIESRYVRPDGTFRDVSFFGAPVDPANPDAGVAIAIQDITDIKKAQEAVRASEFNLRSLFQAVPVGVVLMKDRVFKSVNERICDISGRPTEELVGHSSRILYESQEEFERVGRALYEELWEHGSSYVETRFLRPDGTFRDVSLFGAPVDPAHREAGVAVAIQDITEQHKADAALRESEERFRMLADKLPIQIQLLNEKSQSVYVNQNIRDFFGLQDDLPGENWVRLAHPEDREALVHALHDEQTVDTIARIEFRIQNVHGEYRWLWAMRIPRYTSSGQRIGFITVAIDITDRKKAEEAMRSSVSTLRSLVQAVPVGVALLKDRVFQSVNEQMCEIAGRSASDLLGRSTRLVYESDEEFERIGQELYRSLEEHGIRRLETRILRPDGTLRDVSFSGTLLDSAQPEAGLVIAIEDITERKAAERERQYLQSQLLQSQKMEAVGQLAGGVAHDFNNILAAFLLHLGLLQAETGLSAEIQAELSDLETEANRASTLTRQLLLFSRRHVTQLHVLDVNSLLGNLLKMLRRLIGEHVSLEFEGSSETLWINADGGMIEQVVLNLVVNARDAMPQGGRITLKTASALIGEDEAHLRSPEARPGRYAVISVSDTGCGIQPEVLEHIFEPFFTTKAPGKGTGLGLSAVHGIVAQHQGWVNVRSKPGEGATFNVYIPECEPPVVARSVSGAAAAANLPGGTETILLVEDDPALCRSTSMILRRRGYQIIEAPDAATALELWKTKGPEVQLLLTDMIMPGGMTGLELIQTLHKKAPKLRVILMSGYSAEMVDNGLPMPEQALYLSKPFNSQTLLLKVREQLDRH